MLPWSCGVGILGMRTWQHGLDNWAHRLHDLASGFGKPANLINLA